MIFLLSYILFCTIIDTRAAPIPKFPPIAIPIPGYSPIPIPTLPILQIADSFADTDTDTFGYFF